MKLSLTRREICKLMIACTIVSQISDASPEWMELHDNIKAQLEKLDSKRLESTTPKELIDNWETRMVMR